MPLMPPPMPAAEREERWRERERERDLLRSLWWLRLLRWDLDRFEWVVRAEMMDAASSRMPMVAGVWRVPLGFLGWFELRLSQHAPSYASCPRRN